MLPEVLDAVLILAAMFITPSLIRAFTELVKEWEQIKKFRINPKYRIVQIGMKYAVLNKQDRYLDTKQNYSYPPSSDDRNVLFDSIEEAEKRIEIDKTYYNPLAIKEID